MRTMCRLLAAVVLGVLVASGTAAANHLDPQKKIKPADQARARAMLLKKADLGPGVVSQTNGSEPHVNCTGVDLSDLIVTGEARSPTFARGVTLFTATAEIYRTVADSSASWRQTTGAAWTTCLREVWGTEYAKQGFTLQSLSKLAFPRVGLKTVAFRILLSGEVQGLTVPFTLDVVVLMQSRAQVALIFGSVAAPAKAEELRLVRLTAKRMATAMRSS
jgi:hypothetical protein